MLAKGVVASEGSMVMTNSIPIESEVAIVRRANFKDISRLQLVDKKLLKCEQVHHVSRFQSIEIGLR